MRRSLLLGTLCLLIGCGLGWAARALSAAPRQQTTSLLSPDERWLVSLQESGGFDRNFHVCLKRIDGDHSTRSTLFVSPDEGRPAGSERFLWSSDSRYVLLVGRHFYVAQNTEQLEGDAPYLLYDTASGQVWCNASQRNAERFGLQNLRGKFTLPNPIASSATTNVSTATRQTNLRIHNLSDW